MKNFRIIKKIFNCSLVLILLLFTTSCNKEVNDSIYESEKNNNDSQDENSIFNLDLEYGDVTDQDGNTYKTIKIGSQEWMAENLKTVKYCNGDTIPNIVEDTIWENLTSEAWAHFENDSVYDTPYGKLYNWYAANDERNICPCGWHVPTDSEWSILTDYLGGENIAGGKMKNGDPQYWEGSNAGATNESGFSVISSGSRNFDGSFNSIGFSTFLWSQTEYGVDHAYIRYLYSYGGDIQKQNIFKVEGLSVRCLKD